MTTSPNIPHSPEDLEMEAEELTRIALDDHLSPKQLRILYDIIRTKTSVELKVHVKYKISQMSDNSNPIIPLRTGEKILDLIQKFQKRDLVTIFKFSNMLYDYNKMNSKPRSEGTELNEEVKRNIEIMIGDRTKNFGFSSVSFDGEQTGYLTINVILNRFHGDPKPLSFDLKNSIRNNVKEMRNALFRVWIQKR